MQAVVAVAQLQSRRRSPEAARRGAKRFGTATLAFALAGRHGALPCRFERCTQAEAAGGGTGCACQWEGGLAAFW
ncbi:hypothetical protein IP87_05025 [beta proteobacterium AAP121]|nr:hypothetical protein IP80_15875 [beta proteobacterium AAP65]KPF99591.1 hypothetical protein IP87_05025 [beta proteobacterium AAP121]